MLPRLRAILFLTLSDHFSKWHLKAVFFALPRSDYKLLIYPDGNLVTWFETSDDPLWQALWEKDLQNSIGEWPVDYDDLIELALSDGKRLVFSTLNIISLNQVCL